MAVGNHTFFFPDKPLRKKFAPLFPFAFPDKFTSGAIQNPAGFTFQFFFSVSCDQLGSLIGCDKKTFIINNDDAIRHRINDMAPLFTDIHVVLANINTVNQQVNTSLTHLQ
jgi:hypothetical protein